MNKIRQIKEFPNIRQEHGERISFECSYDLFMRIARSVYTKRIEVVTDSCNTQVYEHFAADRFIRRYNYKPDVELFVISQINSGDILKIINNHQLISKLVWDGGDIEYTLYLSFDYFGRMRINVPIELLLEKCVSYVTNLDTRIGMIGG